MVGVRRIEDVGELMQWRSEVIRNVFGTEPDGSILAANEYYYRKHIADGTHIAVVADWHGAECGCGALCFTDELPSPDNPSGRCAYVMNVYVREPFRNRGIAHYIIESLLAEAEARHCGKIFLETTAEARPVYASLGFREMKDMMKYYGTED